MQKYWGLMLILYTTIAFFFLISAKQEPLNLAGLELRQSSLYKLFHLHGEYELHAENNLHVVETIPTKPPFDSTKKRILLTGDSMVEGLFFAYRDICKANGHEFKAVPVYSSSTLTFAKTDTLKKLIEDYSPDYILLALGSNELFIRGIEERSIYVKDILAQTNDIPIIWIGPPNWKKDTGINDLIEKYIGKKQFYISKDLTLERAKDGAHPTWDASRIWADSINHWIMTQSAFPILLENKKTNEWQEQPNKSNKNSKAI